MKYAVLTLCFFWCMHVQGQAYIIKSVKDFGAKGNGKTNDTEAFQKAAAFFNNRGGQGKLLIPKGIYLIGRQVFSKGDKQKNAYAGANILHFKQCKNLAIEGAAGAELTYTTGMRLGAFDPTSGKVYKHSIANFLDQSFAAIIGYCVFLEQCADVTVTNLRLNGNNKTIEFGGSFNDKGIQLQHYGIFVQNSRRISLNNVYAGYFGLDGISVANKPSKEPDAISLRNCIFEYNSRQGLSWVGGNGLVAINCQFNHSGKSKFVSPPGAGLDLEAEDGAVRNGFFDSCSFINNSGCGIVANSGDVANCQFRNCTVWGTTQWATWITMPGFTFTGCQIYGSIVHGYNAAADSEATRYIRCHFEDKPYNGQPAYGRYLVESDGIKRMFFDSCTFVANTQKLCWLTIPGRPQLAERIVVRHCNFLVKGSTYPDGDFVAILRNTLFTNNTIRFAQPVAEKKRYWAVSSNELDAMCTGNKVIYGQ
jgi:hypothetical protein